MKPPLLHSLTLPSGVVTSQLAFGCASLLRLPASRARARLLHCALDQGIRHFDVARMYGLGAAEGELGRALAKRPEAATLATKFGIPSAAPSPAGLVVQSAGRWLLRQVPALRRRARAGLGRDDRDFSPGQLAASLETSLHELRRDHVELLFLHEPAPEEAIPSATWDALENLRERGTIGGFGFSGPYREESRWTENPRGRLLCQVDLENDQRGLIGGGVLPAPLTVTGLFGLVRGAAAAARARLERETGARENWSQRLAGDLGEQDILLRNIVAAALARNPDRLVVISTTEERRLEALVRFLQQPPAEASVYAGFAEWLTSPAP